MLFKYKLHYRSELHLAVVCNHVIDVFNYYTSQLTSLKNLLQIERSRNSKYISALQMAGFVYFVKNFLRHAGEWKLREDCSNRDLTGIG